MKNNMIDMNKWNELKTRFEALTANANKEQGFWLFPEEIEANEDQEATMRRELRKMDLCISFEAIYTGTVSREDYDAFMKEIKAFDVALNGEHEEPVFYSGNVKEG